MPRLWRFACPPDCHLAWINGQRIHFGLVQTGKIGRRQARRGPVDRPPHLIQRLGAFRDQLTVGMKFVGHVFPDIETYPATLLSKGSPQKTENKAR